MRALKKLICVYIILLQCVGGLSLAARPSTGSMLKDLQKSIVKIKVYTPQRNIPPYFVTDTITNYGTGFIFDKEGYIATNFHLLDQNHFLSKIKVKLHNGRSYKAKIVGHDKFLDLLVLKIEAESSLPAISWANSDEVRLADTVYGMGHPFQLDFTILKASISAINRTITHNMIINLSHLPEGVTHNVFQIDGNLTEGMSGGITVNKEGKVIGINSVIFTPDSRSIGIGFCVPSNTVKEPLNLLKSQRRIKRSYLGIAKGTPTKKGISIIALSPHSPALKAGLQEGDIIQKFNNQTVRSMSSLRYLVKSTPVAQSISLDILRHNHPIKINILTEEKTQKDFSSITEQTNGMLSCCVENLGLILKELTPEVVEQRQLTPGSKGVYVAALCSHKHPIKVDIQRYDIIISINDHPISNLAQAIDLIQKAINEKRPSLSFLIRRPEGEKFIMYPLANKENS